MFKRYVSFFVAAAVAAVLTVAVITPAGATPTPKMDPGKLAALRYLRAHGYFPLRGADVLAKAKAHAAAAVAARKGQTAPAAPASGKNPVIGASWQGISDGSVSPPDTNGAIGPNSYFEDINLQVALYTRTGTLLASSTFGALTGHSQFCLSDPMALWDPATQRFFYNIWDVCASTMAWGFSKDSNPTSFTTGFCNYTSTFGYTTSDLPDYPKLGQTRDFLLIGVNHYTSPNFNHADRTDLLWINKYKDPNPVTTCPASSTFGAGIFKNLKNADGTIAFTPVPAIQTDSSPFGFTVAESDIECPDICGSGTQVTVFGLRPSPTNPAVPQLSKGHSITVGAFESPPDAPQKGTSDTLDTLDGRMTHAVSGKDPSHSSKLAVWVAHSVLGGAGAQINWYEINPLPLNTPTLFQSGTISDSNLYVFNPGISNDRACDLAGCAHGDSMVVGFSTSSSTAYPAAQMVSKIGAGAQSSFVVVKQSTTFDNDFTCAPTCRWGDYGGATPDPTKKTGSTGEVWLTNEWTNSTNQTWNWEATP